MNDTKPEQDRAARAGEGQPNAERAEFPSRALASPLIRRSTKQWDQSRVMNRSQASCLMN
jgi:hypothetical protein